MDCIGQHCMPHWCPQRVTPQTPSERPSSSITYPITSCLRGRRLSSACVVLHNASNLLQKPCGLLAPLTSSLGCCMAGGEFALGFSMMHVRKPGSWYTLVAVKFEVRAGLRVEGCFRLHLRCNLICAAPYGRTHNKKQSCLGGSPVFKGFFMQQERACAERRAQQGAACVATAAAGRQGMRVV